MKLVLKFSRDPNWKIKRKMLVKQEDETNCVYNVLLQSPTAWHI